MIMYISLVIYVCVTLITIKSLTSDCLIYTKSVKYYIIKVKDEDSAITVSTEIGTS